MLRHSFIFINAILLIALNSCVQNSVHTVQISDNWLYKHADTGQWFPAVVPGCVHMDLFKSGMIQDPYFADNEQTLQWIGKTDWEYKTHFNAEGFSNYDNVELIFEGLDTYADVYLNDSLILKADNMFRSWEIDIKNLISPKENYLYIRFYGPERIELDKASMLNYQLPDKRGFTRKAPYQYGWDWGPEFVTSGVWRPVYIRAWKDVMIENIQLNQKKISDSAAILLSVLEVNSSKEQSGAISIFDKKSGNRIVKKNIDLIKGNQNIPIEFSIDHPERWWPNGLGRQNLYTFEFEIKTSEVKDRKKERIGIRTVELVQEKDFVGSSFYFKVNGKPVFMKGANYIPQDNFLARVSTDRYEKIVRSAIDANMNMLRVWGGGIYENDIFYDLCDEQGILVWQDFMFACNMYPGDPAFIENVKQEAIQNVKRLRNHPSLALWCGNNEVDEGWFNWGWQKSLDYSVNDSLEVRSNYIKLFEHVLPDIISELDPQRPYWPSSPSIGWGHEEALFSGDMHYWGVWWGEEPFEVYNRKVGRFMSEYGFQGFPAMQTLDSCLPSQAIHLSSQALLNHQKHPRGMKLIRSYMERDYHVPVKIDDYSYVSQLVQAYGIKTALEAHRRAKPYCMGTLYWQLNDCWPAISWSSVDYYNNWKALHYFVRNAYEDLLISFVENSDSVKVMVVSDKQDALNALLELSIINFEGDIYWSESREINIEKNSANTYFIKETTGFSKQNHLLSAKLISKQELLASNILYFVPVKKLDLPEPALRSTIHEVEKGYIINISTDELAKNVFIASDCPGFFSDNYFDLLPGTGKEVMFETDCTFNNVQESLKIISLNDTF